MLIGILSDTHDQLENVRLALDRFRAVGVDTVIHAGDLVAPFTAKRLLEWQGPLHVVYGNNDGERRGLKAVLPQITDGPIGIDCDGVTISVDHYVPTVARPAVADAQVAVYGHTHEIVNEVRDGILHINPGECCGWVNGRSTVAVLDTERLVAEIITLTSRST